MSYELGRGGKVEGEREGWDHVVYLLYLYRMWPRLY